jgi:transcriptional regulator with XRE-family HTH domain
MASRPDVRKLRKAIGEKVRLLREEKKYTQVQLGKKLGYTSTGSISQIESGARGLPLPSLVRLANFFRVHPAAVISPVEITDPDDLILLSKIICLIEMKRDRPNKAKPLLGAIKAMFEILPAPAWQPFKLGAKKKELPRKKFLDR